MRFLLHGKMGPAGVRGGAEHRFSTLYRLRGVAPSHASQATRCLLEPAGTRAERKGRAFAIAPSRSMARMRGLLLEDIYTSGGTLGECTRVFLRAGAREVRALTLARTTS